MTKAREALSDMLSDMSLSEWRNKHGSLIKKLLLEESSRVEDNEYREKLQRERQVTTVKW
jgi:hypothetical protein